MKKILLIFSCVLFMAHGFAQTEEELNVLIASKKDSIAQIERRVKAIQAKLDALPGWKKGAFGTIGGNLSSFDKWYSQGTPNVDAGNIGVTINAFANLKREQYFWRNNANLNVQWIKFDNRDIATDSDNFNAATDVFNVQSLLGCKLSEKLAVSILGEYRTTILNNFNNPGYLDLGLGGTWTPLENLIVVVHPLNYNFVFSSGEDVFESSLGAKILIDYTRQIGKVRFKSNLSAFQSYRNSNLSNWTWQNAFGYTLWKNIGVGFEFGLRGNRQEAANFAIVQDPTASFNNVDNELQSFWLLGVNYIF
jgi:hypothetical protein